MKLLLSLCLTLPLFAETTTSIIKKNIAYHNESENSYKNERCKLDLYLPTSNDFATVIWLHGGGLKNGSKDNPKDIAIAERLSQDSIAIAMVNYRLHPKAKYPAYVEDTAAAVAWIINNIAEQGGDPKKIFLGGHSAGGYLTLMVGMDPRWLAVHNLKRNDLIGLIPVAAQTMTHYTVRDERFGSNNPFTITADDASPVHYSGLKGIPPVHFLWADNDAPARAEENAYLAAVMKGAGHKAITSKVVANRNHSSVAHHMANLADPGARSLLNFVHRLSNEKTNKANNTSSAQ